MKSPTICRGDPCGRPQGIVFRKCLCYWECFVAGFRSYKITGRGSFRTSVPPDATGVSFHVLEASQTWRDAYSMAFSFAGLAGDHKGSPLRMLRNMVRGGVRNDEFMCCFTLWFYPIPRTVRDSITVTLPGLRATTRVAPTNGFPHGSGLNGFCGCRICHNPRHTVRCPTACI